MKMENKFIYNNQIDITIIGEKDQSDGLGQIPMFIIELLKKNNINYNFHQSHKNYDIVYKKTNFNNSSIKEIGKILINTSFPNEIPPNIGNLNFIYSMYESDKIHDSWVDNINLFYDGVLVPDEWVSEVYKNSGVIKPIYVIPPIILNNKIEIIKTKKHEFIFGLNAQYELRKNHEQVIESFVQIWGNNDKYKLKIHGKHKTHIYENLIKKYKNFENVEITTGILNESELSDWYSDLDCYILASKGEGFSLTPRETILSEIPSILSNYSAHKTLVDTGGILPIDPSGIEPAYKFGLFNDFVGHHATFDTEDIKKSMVSMVSNHEFYKEKIKITKNWILENENIESINNKFLSFLGDQQEKIVQLNNNLFNIKDGVTFGEFNHHNWNYSDYYLSKTQNNPNSDILFDTFLDHTFLETNKILYHKLPYRQKWGGFIHHTWCPDVFINSSIIKYTLDFTFNNVKFIESIKNCVGLITFSKFYKEEIRNYFLKNNIDCNVYSLRLPILNTRKYFFNLEEFKKNKKILFSGGHMRKFETLQYLNVEYEKFYIGSSDEIIKSYFKIIGLELDERIQIFPKVDDYLQFFTDHLLILDFTDANANNSLNECIITQNPVLIRKLPQTVEYLGEDYPLYFESIEEANRKINDLDLIESAHNYLKDNYENLCYNISYEKFNEDFNKISKEISSSYIIKKEKSKSNKYIHLMYLPWENSEYCKDFHKPNAIHCLKSNQYEFDTTYYENLKNKYNDFEVLLWTFDSLKDFSNKLNPGLWDELWSKVDHPVMVVDYYRWFVVYHLGGIYIQYGSNIHIDNINSLLPSNGKECKLFTEYILTDSQMIEFGRRKIRNYLPEEKIRIATQTFSSVPKSKFVESVLNIILLNLSKYNVEEDYDILYITGNAMISSVYDQYSKRDEIELVNLEDTKNYITWSSFGSWRKDVYRVKDNSVGNPNKISIITSLKNAKEYLPQFIEDVIRQTIFEKNCEWIIIDANDNDDDYRLLHPYLIKYPNIIYHKIEKDNGIYFCWNEAIKMSTGDFITNMNCDDRRSPDNLEKMAKLLRENDDVSLVYCDSYKVYQSNINWEALPENSEKYNWSEFEDTNLLYENTPHNNPMWRKELHIKYGFFDEKYKSAADWDFWLRCWYNGEKFKKHPEVLGIYYWNPIGMSSNEKNINNFVKKEEIEIFNKFNSQLESIVHVYVFTWNNSRNLEYFILWYRDRFPNCPITVYDNMSADETEEISRKHNCEHILFDTNQGFNDSVHQEIKNSCWKNQVEPWVFVLSDDELLDISAINLLLSEDDIIFFRGVERFENKHHMLCDAYNKPVGFRKDSVDNMNFTVGCYYCDPVTKKQLKINFFNYYLIHNKWQSLKEVSERNSLLKSKMPNEFTEKEWNFHYNANNEKYFSDGVKAGVDYRSLGKAKKIRHNEYLNTHKKNKLSIDKNKRTDLSICFLTSLSPSHKNYESQVKAIDSWKRFGKIYSINSKSEISHLKKMFPEVNFVLNDRDNESLADYGRPYTYISSFFNLARGLSFDYFCIINSDIIIDGSNDKWEKYLFNLDEESLTVSQRFNFNDTFDDGVIEYWGYDVFTINRKLVDKFPYHTNFLMGQPWWDWWIQIYCMKHRIPVIINNSSIFYHKLHPIQWSQINYEKFAREFSDEFGLDKEPITSSERIEFILNEIKNYGYLIDDNEEREIFNKFNVQLESNQEKRNKKLKIKVTAQIKGFSGYNSASRNIIDQLLDLDFIDLYIDEIDPYENEKCDRISNIDFNKYDRFKVDYDYYDFNIVIYPPTENLICKKSLKNCFLFFWEMYSMYEYHYKVLNDNPELIVMSTSNFLNEIIKHNKLKNKFYKISHVHKRVKKITNKNHKVRYYSICQDVPRKNIKQTIDCFLETFKYVEDVEYNIKISKFNRDLSYWYEYLKKTDKINLITDFLTDDQIDNFHRENDIFYLCQHSEGYGIPHLDALNYGNEVVTNDFGALKDHLNDGNSYLIPYKVDFADFLELHDRDCYFYNLNTKWAVFNNQDIKRTLFNSYMNFKRGIRKNKSLNLEKNNNDILYFLENETAFTNFKNPDFVIVSHDKINNSHGTGIYLSDLTKFYKNFLTISSVHLNSYFEINSHDNNDILDIRINYNDFKHIDISLNDESIKEYFNEKVKNINTKKILSVPYFVDDVINTILLKNKTGAKLVTYILDDQNIVHNNIPDDLMRELLEKSDLRLCISKDMCREYNKKYGLDFYFLPPLVKKESIKKEYTFTHEEWVNTIQKNPGVMVGNIWNPKWLDELSKLTKNLNIQINWFSPQKINNDKIIELRECGINYLGHIPEPELLDILNSSPFGLILTSLNEDDERKDLTFSLSSKLTYMMSAAGLPIISVGDKKTINSKFVKEMNIGLNSEYTINELQDCINEIMNFSSQEKFRKNSYYIGNQLNIDYHCQSKNLEQTSINWIWESCEIGKPINSKYENLDKTLKNSKVIVSSFEINNLHGTGPLIKRVVGGEDNTLVILSKLQYDFKNDFGDVVLHIDSSKIERRAIIDRLGKNEMEQILCVPYLKEDLITSITLHNEFNVPMGCYIMDDQNIVYNNIPDDLMFEFLSKCSVRFVTHPELRDAYENKFKLKFYIIPQIVPDELINKEEYDCEKNSNGAIIGSIWSYNWLKKLCQTLKESNVKVDWYGNNKYPWLIETDEELISYGLNPIGLLSEEELSKKLKSYPYVIVPYGTLEDDDDAKNLTKLSLPGRIIFASATANIPIIVMGSEQCSAAQFVTKFGIGTVCDYNGNSLIEAINFVKENEKELRKNAFLVANNFSSKGIEEFLWQSIKSDVKPFDLRFENIFNDKY